MTGLRRTMTSVLGGLLAAATLSAAAPEETDAGTVPALIQQLGSNRFAVREAATQALEEMGTAALEPLRGALRHEDAEVRRRARLLLRKLEERADAARLLEPQRVRLVYRDTPLAEAVTDLTRKTGLEVRLEGDGEKLAERKVSLDTGEVTCWEALELFCGKAGLVEGLPLSNGRRFDRYSYDGIERRIYATNDEHTPASTSDNRLVLRIGEAKPQPLFRQGALRIRPLPIEAAGGERRTGTETLLLLDVRLEPRLLLEGVLALRLDKAIDEKGQAVTQPIDAVPLPGAFPSSWDETLITWDGVTELPAGPFGDVRRVPVRLKLAEGAPRHLKELQGTLALQLQTPPEPLTTVAELQTSTGQSFAGRHGSAVKVAELRRNENGEYQLRIQVTPPARELLLPGMPARITFPNFARNWGYGDLVPAPVVTADNLTLHDAQGKKLALRIGSNRTINGTARELTVICSAEAGGPTRLMYSGRRSVAIEAPFTLKDVPVP